jgi:hypothetical protein
VVFSASPPMISGHTPAKGLGSGFGRQAWSSGISEWAPLL